MNYNKIDHDSVQSPKYDENIERYGDNTDTCFLCGKKTAKNFYVHYTTDGDLIDAPDESYVSNSQGFFPIGSECAKKLPKSFVFQIS